MIRLAGHHIWDAADMRDSDIISDDDAANGITKARIDPDNAVCILSCTDYPKRSHLLENHGLLRRAGLHHASRRAHAQDPKYAATYRKRLLDAYVIREAKRGEINFAVPFLRKHL